MADFARDTRDVEFERLLRLAASYSARKTPAARAGSRTAVRRSPLLEEIELRAYEIYLRRGAAHGNDLDDWLQAERQVFEALKKESASLRLALALGVLKAPGNSISSP